MKRIMLCFGIFGSVQTVTTILPNWPLFSR